RCPGDSAITASDAVRSRSAHVVLASGDATAQIRDIERSGSVASSPGSAYRGEQVRVGGARDRRAVAQEPTSRCRTTCKIHDDASRNIISTGDNVIAVTGGIDRAACGLPGT